MRNDSKFLSPAEIRIMELQLEGKRIHEIAEALKIKHKTVDAHLGNIHAKLGTVGPVDTAIAALRQHYVKLKGFRVDFPVPSRWQTRAGAVVELVAFNEINQSYEAKDVYSNLIVYNRDGNAVAAPAAWDLMKRIMDAS